MFFNLSEKQSLLEYNFSRTTSFLYSILFFVKMSQLQDRLAELETLEGRSREIQEQMGLTMGNILSAIRAGESSGDKVKDFLRVIGDWSFQYEKNVSDLDARLHGQSGQPVLALEINPEPHSEDDHDLRSRHRIHLTFYLGKINGELSFDLGEKVYSIEDRRVREPRFIIPATQHLQCKTTIHDLSEGDPNAEFYPFSELKWESVNGPLCLDQKGILPKDQMMGLFTSSDTLPTRIYVGKEVEDYFTADVNPRARQTLLYSYSHGAKKLGLNLSSVLQPEVERMITAEKEEITRQVVEVYREELIAGRVSASSYVFKRALELGMDQEPKIVALGRGATLNLPTYILEHCSKHGINLTEEK